MLRSSGSLSDGDRLHLTFWIWACARQRVSGYLNSALEQMDIPDDMRKNYIDDLEIGIMSKFVKPTVAIVGRSDTGKSTLINSLIGAEKMPAKWTPTTSTAVYVKHIKDRPAFIHDEAWIFKRECGNEKFWNSKRLYDEKYCEKWKVAGGDLSLLETYSTRQGGGLKTEAGSAVVFVDAPILLNCDIIDLPGYGTETASDDVITAKTAAHADVLIYLSLASGFLRIEDIEYLKNNVRTLPVLEKKGENGLKPLANLFVVASHADSVDNGNEISLANILKSGCERYMSTLSDSYWKSRAEESGYDYSPAVIQSRFFTYTTDIPALCEKFRNNLEAVLETIPEIVDTECKESVRAYVARKEPNLEAEIQKYEALVEDRQKYVELLLSFSGFLRFKANTLFATNLLAIQPGRQKSLTGALVQIGNFFFGLFKGQLDLLFCQGHQIFVDALQDEVHICPCHGNAAGQGFFVGLGVDVVFFQEHQPDAPVVKVFVQSKTFFCISGHPGY